MTSPASLTVTASAPIAPKVPRFTSCPSFHSIAVSGVPKLDAVEPTIVPLSLIAVA